MAFEEDFAKTMPAHKLVCGTWYDSDEEYEEHPILNSEFLGRCRPLDAGL